jgi:hypothetical protein
MSIITAALNPIERYVWGAALVILISFGVYEREHLIHEGEQKIEVAEATHAKVVAQKDSQIQAAEQKAADQAGIIYEKAIAIPPVDDVGLKCVRNAATPAPPVPSSAPADPGASSAQSSGGTNSPNTGTFDPSGALLTLGRNADAEISALQQENAILRDLIEKANEAAK